MVTSYLLSSKFLQCFIRRERGLFMFCFAPFPYLFMFPLFALEYNNRRMFVQVGRWKIWGWLFRLNYSLDEGGKMKVFPRFYYKQILFPLMLFKYEGVNLG